MLIEHQPWEHAKHQVIMIDVEVDKYFGVDRDQNDQEGNKP
jgi:hypothetical protein